MSGGVDWEHCDCSTVREVISSWVTSEKRSGGTEQVKLLDPWRKSITGREDSKFAKFLR